MEPIIITTVVCSRCELDLDLRATACPHCGWPAEGRSSQPAAAAPDRSLQALLDNRMLLLLLLFGVTAAMGIPFLWRSRAFSRRAKAVLTLVVAVYTVLILWVFWLVLSWCLASIRASLGW